MFTARHGLGLYIQFRLISNIISALEASRKSPLPTQSSSPSRPPNRLPPPHPTPRPHLLHCLVVKSTTCLTSNVSWVDAARRQLMWCDSRGGSFTVPLFCKLAIAVNCVRFKRLRVVGLDPLNTEPTQGYPSIPLVSSRRCQDSETWHHEVGLSGCPDGHRHVWRLRTKNKHLGIYTDQNKNISKTPWKIKDR